MLQPRVRVAQSSAARVTLTHNGEKNHRMLKKKHINGPVTISGPVSQKRNKNRRGAIARFYSVSVTKV